MTTETKERDYYKVLLVSQSGRGKTFSFRNMNSETTGFINVENKPLPFKNEFKYHYRPDNYVDAYNKLIEYAKDPNIDCIVLDSLSSYLDMVVLEARKTKKNFDIWNMVNDEASKIFNIIKRIKKEVFVTAHYEILGIEGSQEKRVKIKGKEHEGNVEKDFTIVLYADRKLEGDKKQVNAWFDLALENSSAKCPPDIFGADVFQIPNDSKLILDKIKEFTK